MDFGFSILVDLEKVLSNPKIRSAPKVKAKWNNGASVQKAGHFEKIPQIYNISLSGNYFEQTNGKLK